MYARDLVRSFHRNYLYKLRGEVYSQEDKAKIKKLAQTLAEEFSNEVFQQHLKHASVIVIGTDGEVMDYRRENQNRSHFVFRVYFNLTKSGSRLSHLEVTVNIDVDNMSSDRKIYVYELKFHDAYYWD